MIFRFCFYRGEESSPWRDIHTLCLRSCFKHTGAQKIVVYYESAGEGPDWDEAQSLPGIEWVSVRLNPTGLTDSRLVCDLFRLQILYDEGGFFCDLDFVFFARFDKLRHHPAVIGTACKAKKKLATNLIGAEAGSAFVSECLAIYKHTSPDDSKKTWNTIHSAIWALGKSQHVHVLPRPVLYPWCWSNKKFLTGGAINTKKSVAIHLWSSLYPDMTVATLRDTNINNFIDSVLGISQLTHITSKTGVFILFA